MSCPDCKDGFYYPFVGPPEPCQTCTKSFCLTFPLDDFKNQLMQRLKNIDLSPISIVSGAPSQNDWFISQILRDGEKSYIVENYVDYFYDAIKIGIITATKNYTQIKLDFSESTILTMYDILKCGLVMTIRFSIEMIK